MKRRCLIFAAALALYAALLSVIWAIGSHQAAKDTEAQLDYAILDFRSTIGGAIDTMLGYVARTAVRNLGSARELPLEHMAEVARYLDIDEVNVVSREGVILASNDPYCLGVRMAGNSVMEPFMELTNGSTASVSQPFRAHAMNPSVRAKYLGVAFPGGDGFVQVGLDERHLAKMLPGILGYIFDEWLLGKTGFFLCADVATDKMISNPSRHRGEASTLAGAGFDAKAAQPYEITSNTDPGTTFRQRLFGEDCYCRNYLFGGHRFVPALPEREYYDTRKIFVTVMAVLLFAVLGAFAFFMDRIFRDSDRLKAFYAGEEERRNRALSIAKTIQLSALPTSPPESPSFRIEAAMQAAKEVGGDFYDYFMLDGTHIAFLVADVSGKGITAALYMMTAKTLIKDTLLSVRDPAAALTKVNAELCRSNPANMFLTAWVGVLDIETGVVTFANAGHNPPVKFNGRKLIAEKSGPVLAFMDGIVYKPRTTILSPGDSIFLYTDGVTEALDSRDALFGEEKLIDTLKVAPSSEPHSLCTLVRAAVAAFSEGVPQADDITVLALKYITPPRTFSRSFPPTKEGIAAASEYLDDILKAPAPVIASVHVMLDEICSNIVKHSGASGFAVDVELTERPDGVKLTFVDDGVAYDPLAHADPDITLSAEERPIGGLGIFLVRKMADAVYYNRQHNHNFLTVVKKF